MATVEYDDILLKFSSSVNTRGISTTINALEKLKDINGFSGLKQAGQDLQDFINVLNGLSSGKMKTITEFAKAIKGVGGIGKAMKAVAKTAESGNPLNDTSTGVATPPKGFADMQETSRMLAPTWQDIWKAISNSGQAMKTVGDNAIKAKEATKEVSKEAKKALSPMEKLANRFKSFLQYRAMRAVWSAFVNGLKEGLKNLEDWDRSTGMTGFAESMDRARESLLVLKNSLAVITAPALEWLIGVLQKVATWAMTASNAISRFFAILGGKSTYRAVIWADTLAESEAKAGGSAKKATQEFKKQLMAFDEINNITAQNDSGSGGGGGSGSGAKYTEMFEERSVGELSNVEKMFQAIIDKIKEVVKELTPLMNKLKSIGLEIAKPAWEGFKRVLESIAGLFIGIVDVVGSLIGTLARLVIGVDNATQAIGGLKAIGLILQGTFYALAGVIDLITAGIRTISYVVEVVGYEFEYWGKIIGNVWDLLARKQSFEEFKNNIRSASEELETKGRKAVNDLKADLDRVFNHTYYLKTTWDDIRNIHINEIYTAIGSKGMRTVEKYASGGIVPQGQLFIAREAGAEMVGQIGGRTAVANNQDIVNAVSQGVASAVASVMGGGSNVTVTLEGDAKGIFKVVQKEGRAYSARTGQPALA